MGAIKNAHATSMRATNYGYAPKFLNVSFYIDNYNDDNNHNTTIAIVIFKEKKKICQMMRIVKLVKTGQGYINENGSNKRLIQRTCISEATTVIQNGTII